MPNRSTGSHRGVLVLAALLVGVPLAIACVIPRTLAQQIGMAGDEILVARVDSVREIDVMEPDGFTFTWTIADLSVEESLVTGSRGGTTRVAMRGGVRPGSRSTSITPSPEDMKPGRRLLLFLASHTPGAGLPADVPWIVPSFAEVYRIESVDTRTGPREVLLGQGAGAAFPDNRSLAEAREEVIQLARTLRKR